MMLHVDSRAVADRTQIDVRGELDLATVGTLRRALLDAMGAGAHRIHLGLDEVTYIDSTGLGMIIGAHRRLSAVGGELVVQCAVDRVRKLLRMTGLDKVLTIEAGDETAPV
jgi:anti-sigma B factor antagonist